MTISRRQVLKHSSIAGGGLAISPLLMPFVARAQAEADGHAPPKRFVFFLKSSGLTPAEIVPQEMRAQRVEDRPEGRVGDGYTQPFALRPADKLIDESLEDTTLHPTMKALEPFKKRIAIVQGLSGKMCKGGHSSHFGAMGCFKGGGEHNSGNIRSATIDGEMAKHLPAIFPHVGLCVSGRLMGGSSVADGVIYPGVSAIDRNRELPFQATPLTAYRELFSVAATSENDLMENRLSGTLLDFMVDDIKRLQGRIGSAEKEKLDIYLEGFESLRERRRKLKGVEAQIRKHAPVVSDKYSARSETDRLEAHMDLTAAALIAGLTNVVTIRADTLSTMYTELGSDKAVHGLGHGEGEDPNGNRGRIREHHFNMIARLAKKLQSTPEGAGNMLDNTMIVYFSDAGEKHHATSIEWPFVLLGGLGGRIKTTGRYLQYPSYGKPGHHTIANLYNTLSHAAGRPQDTMGQLDLSLDEKCQHGPLAELFG